MEKKFVPSEVGSEKLSVEGRISQAGGRGKRELRPSNPPGMKLPIIKVEQVNRSGKIMSLVKTVSKGVLI